MNEKIFELGERRRVTLEVWVTDGTALPLTNSTWELYDENGDTEASGSCEAAQEDARWQLTAEVQPGKRGAYRLQYTFAVGTEIFKRSAGIKVI